MTNSEKRLYDIRYKIRTVKENRNNHFRFPAEILMVLYKIEMHIEDNIFSSRAVTKF